jgi:glycosyltransferase involved in cell wall biosynthesis
MNLADVPLPCATLTDPSAPNRPILSVITPVYQGARFLPETLDGVAALRTPHEHLVIDGGSTDGTVQILRKRQDRSLVWFSERDRGQTHAVNKGLEQANGELLAWLNADDVYVPQHVDAAVSLLLDDPSIDAVFGFMDIVDEDGHLTKQYRCGPFSWRRYLYLGDYLPTSTLIFRRALLERAPQLDERYADAADCDFYLRLLRGARVTRVRRPLVRFRYHAASKTASNIKLQMREAREIRLRHARSPAGRWLIRSVTRAKRVRESLVPSWPEL